MPLTDELLSQINQPPEKAIEFLNKKFPVLKADYEQLNTEARARAFTIARITELDVLQTVLTGLEVATKSGTGFKEFKKGIGEYLTKTGWYSPDEYSDKITPRRLELIYKTNTDSAIASGRWQQLWDNRESRPYLQYRIDQLGVSEKHRVEHEILNGRVFRIDDPVWDAIYPPRGFRCNCGVVSVSDTYIKRKGLKVEESGKNLTVDENGVLQYSIKTADGKTVTIKPPTGFESNVGKSGLVALDEILINKLSLISTQDAQRRIALDIINNPARRDEFEQWVQTVTTKGYQSNSSMRTVGVLQKEILAEIQKSGSKAQSQIIVVTDKNLQHANRDAKTKAGKSLGVEGLKKLPQYIAEPDYILSEKETPNDFIYITLNKTSTEIKQDIVVISTNYNIKKKGITNVAVTAQVLPLDTYLKEDLKLRDKDKYKIIYQK
jgi:SPP1 gp7 family putative phage head morphogenesis protein